MGNLAGAGDSPAIGMVAGLANSTDLDPAWIVVLDRIQAVGADVFFFADEFDLWFGILFRLPGWLFGFWLWRCDHG